MDMARHDPGTPTRRFGSSRAGEPRLFLLGPGVADGGWCSSLALRARRAVLGPRTLLTGCKGRIGAAHARFGTAIVDHCALKVCNGTTNVYQSAALWSSGTLLKDQSRANWSSGTLQEDQIAPDLYKFALISHTSAALWPAQTDRAAATVAPPAPRATRSPIIPSPLPGARPTTRPPRTRGTPARLLSVSLCLCVSKRTRPAWPGTATTPARPTRRAEDGGSGHRGIA